jgi:hypothetical protein
MVAKLLMRANRKKLSDQTIKELFALTGNQCAKCNIKLVYTEIHAVRGIICHIEAASSRGHDIMLNKVMTIDIAILT